MPAFSTGIYWLDNTLQILTPSFTSNSLGHSSLTLTSLTRHLAMCCIWWKCCYRYSACTYTSTFSYQYFKERPYTSTAGDKNISIVQDKRLTIFTRPANTCACPLTDFKVNTQKMLVSPSDFRKKLERSSNSSQSSHPTGRVLSEELLILSRFHS